MRSSAKREPWSYWKKRGVAAAVVVGLILVYVVLALTTGHSEAYRIGERRGSSLVTELGVDNEGFINGRETAPYLCHQFRTGVNGEEPDDIDDFWDGCIDAALARLGLD